MAARPARGEEGNADDVIAMSDVSFSWQPSAPFVLNVNAFRVARRESVLLVGPSGSGKSTFLSLVCGVVTPASGRIDVLGHDITRLAGSARDRFRAEHIGIIFQMFNLLPYGSVLDNVLLPLSFAAGRRRRATEARPAETEAARLLERLGLDEDLLHERSAARLSVGQQQRVAAARALIGTPELVVADEPTSALDRNRQDDFLDLLFDQVEEAGSTLIIVSHDESLAPRFNRILPLSEVVDAAGAAAP